MSTLTNQKIKDTFQGLIKTANNAAITSTPISLQDGVGNTINIEIGTNQINFPAGIVDFTGSAVDFTGATVTGLPTPAADGLVSGGANAGSMKSSDALSDGNNNANAYRAIAIGSGNIAGSNGAVLGMYSRAGDGSVAIGDNANNTLGAKSNAVSIGPYANAHPESVSIGTGAASTGDRSVSIGRQAKAAANSIAIGNYSGGGSGSNSISMAACSVNVQTNNAVNSIMLVPGTYGCELPSGATDAIVLGAHDGGGNRVTADAGIAIGKGTFSTAAGAVALGAGVTAATVDTVTIKKLQMLDYATLDFANDAAAATAGIPLGGVYHTSGSLKIRIA